MEMIMSISSALEAREAGGAALTTLAAAVRRLCAANIVGRMEQAAIVLLHAMSDQELSDTGLPRGEIDSAVRGEAARIRNSVNL
jgi:uncharacterized protein YjiS (DUF1127 family)